MQDKGRTSLKACPAFAALPERLLIVLVLLFILEFDEERDDQSGSGAEEETRTVGSFRQVAVIVELHNRKGVQQEPDEESGADAREEASYLQRGEGAVCPIQRRELYLSFKQQRVDILAHLLDKHQAFALTDEQFCQLVNSQTDKSDYTYRH